MKIVAHVKRQPVDTGPPSQQLTLWLLPPLYITNDQQSLLLVRDKPVSTSAPLDFEAHIVVSTTHPMGASGVFTKDISRDIYTIGSANSMGEWWLIHRVCHNGDICRLLKCYSEWTPNKLKTAFNAHKGIFNADEQQVIMSVMFPSPT